ncbi:MAG: FAD-dependent oxidoreductase [Pseudomonadota bacterium]
MDRTQYLKISGIQDDKRISSRLLEQMIQQEVDHGHRAIEVEAFGQHGIGGRLWKAGDDPVRIRITGYSGQRTGSLGFPNTQIEIMGPASDDIGWLNAGAEIIVHGNASNGAMNGGAQGKVYVGGNIGARGMTMTKRNPRFDPPELWVLGCAGDYFGEFMAGGIAVICGFEARDKDNVLGYRPFVGMVGGKAFFRGQPVGFSANDTVLAPITDSDWDWLMAGMALFLEKINRKFLFDRLSKRSEWQLLRAKTPKERMETSKKISMATFRQDVWDRELGKGGLIGDLQDMERGAIPIITKGELRRFLPMWENNQYKSPCQMACPIGIPIQERWHMIRSGLVDEALELSLAHTPFPSTVCGYLCPSPCMASCTRNTQTMEPIDVRIIGRAGQETSAPSPAAKSGRTVAIIGAGPGGLSAAWHLTLRGHEVVVFDEADTLGGKIASLIPDSRIPRQTLAEELGRIRNLVSDIRLGQTITSREFKKVTQEFDFTIVAAGAKKPRRLPLPGAETAITYADFLSAAKTGAINPGKRVIIIGAGNVGCDVATEAYRLGAETVTMIDVQKPAAFGKEKQEAEAAGATFRWPCFTREIHPGGVLLDDGEFLESDTVVISIGDVPDLDFLSASLTLRHGFVVADGLGRTSDPRIFAIGDAVMPGLITDAIGAGKRTAEAIDRIMAGKNPETTDARPMIDTRRVSLEYFNPMGTGFDTLDRCGSECASCGRCRDCGICVAMCPEGAISRSQGSNGKYAYNADPDKCIGCGFCAGACPCGIWNLVPNTPL